MTEGSGDPGRETAHERVYRELRARIIGGRMVPGRPVTLRGLAAELDVSPMPVREAVGRLVAERALEMKANRRVSVPEMTAQALDELVLAREALEPEAARRALPQLGRTALAKLRRIDDELETCLKLGNVEGYVASNHAFHFTIYRACGTEVLVPLIESLWLRTGPFMRVVYGRIGTSWVVDHHETALQAIERRDADGLAAAIRDDIREGMGLMAKGVLPVGLKQRAPVAG